MCTVTFSSTSTKEERCSCIKQISNMHRFVVKFPFEDYFDKSFDSTNSDIMLNRQLIGLKWVIFIMTVSNFNHECQFKYLFCHNIHFIAYIILNDYFKQSYIFLCHNISLLALL